jgi:hypothetical protein
MSTTRGFFVRCAAVSAVALLTIGTGSAALADPGNGKGNGPPDDKGKPAATEEKGPSANANAKATEKGPSANANANATKKQAATATAAPADNGGGNGNAGGNGNGNGAGGTTSTVTPAATEPVTVASDPVVESQLVAIAAAVATDPPGNRAASANGGSQGLATGRSADPSDATLGQSLGPGNRGTGKIHRDETSPLDRRNQPKVGCFDVTGFHFDPNQQLAISIRGHGGPNAGRGSLAANTSSDGSGNLLLNSQSLPAGMYKLTISTDRPGGVKHKVFKVTGDCVRPPGVTPPGLVEPPGGAPPRVVRVEGPVRERPVRPESPDRPVIPERPVTPLSPPAVPGVAQPGVPTLAFTGSSTPELVALGGSLVLLGAFALLATRRRSPAA